MTAARRLVAILTPTSSATQAGPAREVREHREATNPISFIAYGCFASDRCFLSHNPE